MCWAWPLVGFLALTACERPAVIDPATGAATGPMPIYAPPPPMQLPPYVDPPFLDQPFRQAIGKLRMEDGDGWDDRRAGEVLQRWRGEPGGFEARDAQGNTRLMLACWAYDLHHIYGLLQADVDLDARNHRGQTALHLAAAVRGAAVVDLLLRLGADPDAADDRGWTPLHVAAFAGRGASVARLLEHGADADARTADGLRAVDLGRQAGHDQLLETLSAGAGGEQPTDASGARHMAAGLGGDLVMLALLLVLGLLAAWLRWGRLGLLAFAGLFKSGAGAAWPGQPGLLASRPVRLLLWTLAFFLIGWAGVMARVDLQTLGIFIGGGGP